MPKSHSVYTIIVVLIAASSLRTSPWASIRAGWFLLGIVLGIVLAIVAFYEWRLFLRARKEGLNHDRNLFLQESAGKLRKVVFFISLALYVLHEYVPLLPTCDVRYATSINTYFQQFGVYALGSVVFFAFFVEFMRIPTGMNWSTRKHFTIIIVLSLTTSALRVAVLYALWGHSALWWRG